MPINNFKHTPGPWEILSDSIDTQYDIFGDGKEVASTVTSWTDDEENLANTKLIAAAPDLLEACQNYIRIINDEGCIPDMEQIGLTAKISMAIKKATE